MFPEYSMLEYFLKKSDVFSYGVLILEIITEKRGIQILMINHMVQVTAS